MAQPDINIKISTDGASKAGSDLKGVGGAADDTGGKMDKLAGVAATAGVALVGLAVAGVTGYEALGVKVGQLSDATGLTADAASRLIDVGDHLGVSSQTLESGIGKMEKALGANADAFDKYGVTVAHTKDGQIDANATFLNAVGALNAIQDPAARATAGAAIFGKGWQGMAELVGQGSAKLSAALASVDPDKVFTAEGVERARALRESFKQIKDSGEDLGLSLGRALAPSITTVATDLAGATKSAEPFVNVIGESLASAITLVLPLIKDVTGLLSTVATKFDDVNKSADTTPDALKKFSDVFTGLKGQDPRAQIIGIANAFEDLRTSVDSSQSKLQMAGEDVKVFTEGAKLIAEPWKDGEASAVAWADVSTAAFEKVKASSTDAAQQLITSLRALATGGSDFAKDQLKTMGITLPLLDQWQTELGAVTAAASTNTSATDDNTSSVAANSDVLRNAFQTGDVWKASIDQKTAAIKAQTDAEQAASKAEDDWRSAQEAAADATFAAQRDTLAAADAVAAYAKVLKDHKSTTEDVEKATLDAAQAQVQAAQDYSTSTGAAQGSQEQADRLKDSLSLMAAEATGPLQQALLGYIATLDNIPRNVATVLTVGQGGGVSLGKGVKAFAAGGPASGPSIINDGPGGGELVNLPDGSVVVPADKTNAILGTAGGVTAGQASGITQPPAPVVNHYYEINITVHGSVQKESDMNRSIADGIIDMVKRGVLPPNAFG